jgi:GT2 family glycosyltransferase
MELLARSLPVFLRRPADIEVVVINNDPSQDLVKWFESHFGTVPRVIEMGYEAGFARAINRGIEISRGEFVMFCNADFFATEQYLDEIVRFFGTNRRAAAASGKILRYDLVNDEPTDIIDTAGLRMARNRRGLARGEGQRDVGQFDDVEEVFGNDGVGLVIRRSALENIRVAGEYLDESFFMYKEDWDLSWRVRLAGWECWYVPSATGFHGRTSRGLGEASYLSGISKFHENERRKPEFVRVHSMKNQWLMLLKNEDWHNFWRDAPYILTREGVVVLYSLVFSPRTLVAIPRFLRLAGGALAKRRAIKGRQIVSAAEIRRWFVLHPST